MKTRNGKTVRNVTEYEGMLRGFMTVGKRQETGDPIQRPIFWYPNGRLTPARTTPFDLILTGEFVSTEEESA